MFKQIAAILAFFLIASFTAFSQSFKVMTYNIRLELASDGQDSWPNRKEFLLSQLRFHAPDIIGIQEALPAQSAYINNQLPHYQKVGIGRDAEGNGEASNIFFLTSRFQLKDSGTFWLSETPDRLSKGWDAALNRICTYVLLKDKKTKRSFWVFNAHFDHIGENARKNSVNLILSMIKQKNGRNYPYIFMGDLNSEPATPQVQILREAMLDAKEASLIAPLGPEGTFNGFKYQEAPTKRIDYIFVSRIPAIKVLKYGVLTDAKDFHFPSDHFPVMAELSLQ